VSRVSQRDPRPPYIQIAEDLRARIRGGDLGPGDKLPSGRQLADDYGVAAMTVQHALRMLRDDGLITTWQGRGVFVADPLPEDSAGSERDEASPYAKLFDRVKALDANVQRLGERLARLEAREGDRPR
jgi:GntR family transcriptional regulator